MQTAARKIKETAPYLWTLVNTLLDANPARRQAMPPSESQIMEELAAQTEGDLGEIGGEDEAGNSDEDKDMGWTLVMMSGFQDRQRKFSKSKCAEVLTQPHLQVLPVVEAR